MKQLPCTTTASKPAASAVGSHGDCDYCSFAVAGMANNFGYNTVRGKGISERSVRHAEFYQSRAAIGWQLAA